MKQSKAQKFKKKKVKDENHFRNIVKKLTLRHVNKNKVTKMHIFKRFEEKMIVRCWPPSISTALTKQRWRSGVHLSRGTGDRTYGLTPPPL